MSLSAQLYVSLALVCLGACKPGGGSATQSTGVTPASPTSAAAANAAPAATPGLYHIVTLRFSASATDAQIQDQIKAFAMLKTTALDPQNQPYLLSWSYGPNNSQIDVSFHPTEKGDHSREYVFVTTLANAAQRDLYIATPAHTNFLNNLVPFLDNGLTGGIFVSDFEPKPSPL